jgi:hypothetical protein
LFSYYFYNSNISPSNAFNLKFQVGIIHEITSDRLVMDDGKEGGTKGEGGGGGDGKKVTRMWKRKKGKGWKNDAFPNRNSHAAGIHDNRLIVRME